MPDCAKIIGIFIIPRIVCFHPVNLFLQVKLQTGKLQISGVNLLRLA